MEREGESNVDLPCIMNFFPSRSQVSLLRFVQAAMAHTWTSSLAGRHPVLNFWNLNNTWISECYKIILICLYNLHLICVGQIKGFSTRMRPWNSLRSDLTGAFTAEGHRAKWIAHPPAAASPQIHVVHLANHGIPSFKIIASWCKKMRRTTRYAITGLSQWWNGIYYSTMYVWPAKFFRSFWGFLPLCRCLHSICKNVPILLRRFTPYSSILAASGKLWLAWRDSHTCCNWSNAPTK